MISNQSRCSKVPRTQFCARLAILIEAVHFLSRFLRQILGCTVFNRRQAQLLPPNISCLVRSEVPTSLFPRIQAFWNVTLGVWFTVMVPPSSLWCRSGSWTARPFRWRHHDHSTHWEPLTQWHCVTVQKMWILSNTAVRTLSLAHVLCCTKYITVMGDVRLS